MLDQKMIIDKTISRLEESAIVPFQDINPKLTVVYNEKNKSDLSYLKSLQKAAEKYKSRTNAVNCGDIFEVSVAINEAKKDSDVNGIIIISDYGQATRSLYNMIPARLDIDGLSVLSLGKLYGNTSPIAYRYAPCTPVACLKILQEVHHELTHSYDLSGMTVGIIGRSLRVGRPLAELLLQQNCLCTVYHSKARLNPYDLAEKEVIISACGKPYIIGVDYIGDVDDKIFIDVGINVDKNGKIIGDLPSWEEYMDWFEKEEECPLYLTPVPGGVGKVTTTVLFAKLFANKVAFIGGDLNE